MKAIIIRCTNSILKLLKTSQEKLLKRATLMNQQENNFHSLMSVEGLLFIFSNLHTRTNRSHL